MPEEWTSYAETAGWDILLVRKTDGFQIGIQAKLKITPFVMAQCLDEYPWSVDRPRPDAIADAYWQLHNQQKSAWTHEMDLRPWLEAW